MWGNIADPEDVVQDALLSALKLVDEFSGQAKTSTWLTAIVINSARMRLCRRPSQLILDETGREQGFLAAELPSKHQPSPEQLTRTCGKAGARDKTAFAYLRRSFQLRDPDGLTIRETHISPECHAGQQRYGWQGLVTKGNAEKQPPRKT